MHCITADDVRCLLDDGGTLFSDISLTCGRGLSALVGPNGHGKTTLARILAGATEPSFGIVRRRCRVLMLEQTPIRHGHFVRDVIDPDGKLRAIERLDAGGGTPADVAVIGDDWRCSERLTEALSGAGLGVDFDRPLSSLSGGERTRLALARLFMDDDAFLVLDEPTNNLDEAGRVWLMECLRCRSGGALVVTHDRTLLTQVSRIFELAHGRLRVFGGNFELYERERRAEAERAALALERDRAAVKRLERERRAAMERAERRSRSGRKDRAKGSQPKMVADMKAERAENGAGKAERTFDRRREEAECRLLDSIEAARSEKPLGFTIADQERERALLVRAEGVRLPHGTARTIDAAVYAGSRMRIAGLNGTGKSTLLRVLAGECLPESGIVKRFGRCVMVDQFASMLDDEASALDNYRRLMPGMSDGEYRLRLAGIHMRKERAFLPAGTLSGGERMKLALVAAMNGPEPADVLLLDEPDNHIDMDAKRVIEAALAAYRGAFLLVSHDQAFVDAVGIDEVITLE